MNEIRSGPPVHFTYQPVEESDRHLCQGDILRPNDKLREVLGQVHPHFTDDKYSAFLVLTQTCDLVPRAERECRSRYVTLCVVRALRDVLIPLLDRECGKLRVRGHIVEGVYAEDSRYRAKQLLERILNQNAQAEGLFYLHSDSAVGIVERSVAMLQVSFAVRAHEHYDTLVRARTGRLKEQFQSKLGWLMGYLFSRVATEDMDSGQRDRLVAEMLDPPDDSDETVPRWVPRANISEANKARADVAGKRRPEIATILMKHRPTPPKDIAIRSVVTSLREVFPGISEEQITDFKNRLAGDAVFESACKR
jgi:hypothetical protein